MLTIRPDVFISATSNDLKSIRGLIKETLLDKDYFPVEQSHFSPDYRSVKDMLYERLKGCHALIHVVGLRYGAEPQCRESYEPRMSYTQMEYYIAKELGLEIYTFICLNIFPFDKNIEIENLELQELQNTHRKRLLNNDILYVEADSKNIIKESVLKLNINIEKLRSEIQEDYEKRIDVLKKRDEVRSIMHQLNKVLSQYASKFANIDKNQRFEMALSAVSTNLRLDIEEIRMDIKEFVGFVNDIQNDICAEDLYQVKMYEQKYIEAAALMEKAASVSLLAAYSQLILAGDAQMASLDFKKANNNYNKVLNILKFEDANDTFAEIHAKIGIAEFYIEDYNESDKKLTLAFDYYLNHDKESEELGSFLYIAAGAKVGSMHKQGFTPKALKWANKFNLSAKLFNAIHYSSESVYLCADLYKQLSDIYAIGDDNKSAFIYYENLIQWINENKYNKDGERALWIALQCNILNEKGNIYKKIDNINESLKCYDRALSIVESDLYFTINNTELLFQKSSILYSKAELLLHCMDKLDEANEHYQQALDICLDLITKNGSTFRFLRHKRCCLNGISDFYYQKENIDSAIILCDETLQLSRKILNIYSKTAQGLRDVAIDAGRKADVLYYSKIDIDCALALYNEGLTLIRGILTNYGQTAERLNDIAIFASKKADLLYHSKNDIDSALILYDESFLLSRQILSCYDQTAQRLSDAAAFMSKKADLLYNNNDVKGALALCDESLLLGRRILAEYGQTVFRLERVASYASGKADILYKSNNDIDGALALYNESLSLSRCILSDYEPTPRRLRYVFIFASKIADILYKSNNDIGSALILYDESLSLSRRILTEYGQTDQRINDVSILASRKADILYSNDDVDSALVLFNESLSLSRRILADYRQTVQRLQKVLVNARKIAKILQKHNINLEGALKLYAESINICFRLLKDYGANADRYNYIYQDICNLTTNDQLFISSEIDFRFTVIQELIALNDYLLSNKEEKNSIYYEAYISLQEITAIIINKN